MTGQNVQNRVPLRAAKRYAALSGAFDPKEALRRATRLDADIAIVASLLASACDTDPHNYDDRWLMRLPERRFELRALQEKNLLEKMIRWRRRFGTDQETDDLHAALRDQPPLCRAGIEQAIDDGPRELLERMVVALDWAGDLAPSADLLPVLRSAIAMRDQRQRFAEADARPFVGRQPEREQIQRWLERPISVPPVRCMYIQGGPSVGKSSLLAKAVAEFHAGRQPIILRFDFDWAGLDIQDKVGFTMEAARQLAQQSGRAATGLTEARLDAARRTDTDIKSAPSNRDNIPVDLARRMAEVLISIDRPLLVVLDTMEILRAKGETHPRRLFEWLDEMVRAGIRPLRVIAAGRGQALDGCPDRIAEAPLPVDRLDDDAAGMLLDRLNVPRHLRQDLLRLANGNPLKLKLASEIVTGGEAEWARGRRRGKEVSATYLYRSMLSRIDDPDLRRLLNPGLVLGRFSAELITDVLAPLSKLRGITKARAQALANELEGLHWLLEKDPAAPEFLKSRPEMRSLLVPLLYSAAPKACARINRAAAEWFAKHDASWARAEALFHRLQLLRLPSSEVPIVDWETAVRIDPVMRDELPPRARDLLLNIGGERSGLWRAGENTYITAKVSSIVGELKNILQRGDWLEGLDLVGKVTQAEALDPASETADGLRVFFWRSGHWSKAMTLLKGRDQTAVDRPLSPEATLPTLEMRAEFQPRRFGTDLKSYHPALNLRKLAGAAADNVALHGAMAFLTDQIDGMSPLASRGDFNAAGTAVALCTGHDERGHLRSALAAAHSRFRGDPLLEQARSHMTDPAMIAALTPYATVARNLLSASSDMLLTRYTVGVLDRLALHVNLPSGASAIVSDPLSTLTGLGFFAEWAGAACFLHRNPDLRLIARAAERWRRTMAGDWSYGPAPNGSSSPMRPDRTLRQRIDDLMASSHPAKASLAALGIWSQDGGQRLHATLRWRLCRTLKNADALWPEGPHAVAAHLISRQVPAAFVPPLTVLTFHR
ncbi:ATP-binding protein [Asticcacaulis sp.]|uniref:ATP-binding protein n=1 Tax=Asticcacaulis sp. TaxID=1872648 RepID=UPI0026245862|nr:ATP-binding protein [Asticcacaulis sp.]